MNLDDLDILNDEEAKKENETPKAELSPPKFKNVGRKMTEKVKGLIFWMGFICSSISAIAYIMIVVVMNTGFKSEFSLVSNVVFATITAFVGLLISQFLKMQGIAFAKSEPEVKEIWEKFYKRHTPKRKCHSLTYFWFWSVVTDIILKALSTAAICIGTAYIFIEANGDFMRVLMAVFNLTLFCGFGMMSLAKFYDITRERHVAWMLRQIKENEEVHNVKEKENTADSGADLSAKLQIEQATKDTDTINQVDTTNIDGSVFLYDGAELSRQFDRDNDAS